DRLVELYIISPDATAAPFSRADMRRVRFIRGLEQGGVPLEAMGSAVRMGALSFAFFDAPYWDRFGGLAATTYHELSLDSGLSVELLLTIRESMGYARPGPEDRVREDELLLVPLVKTLIAMGADPLVLERHIRSWGENMRRIAEADGNFYRTQIMDPMLQAGLNWSDVVKAASEANESMVPLLDPALLSVYHAQSEHTWMANIVEAVETTLELEGLHRSIARPPAMCFLDLTGYTLLTEQRGDEAAAAVAALVGTLVQRGSHARGGRPVKWLGDGVMVFFKEPSAVVSFALETRNEIEAADLLPAHVGITAGPVVFQDGDYFGRTVNLAARIAGHAKAGQVLVTDEVVQLTTDPRIAFTEVGSVSLKGVSQPVRLHEAHLADTADRGAK
ncbi:MAG TPA: adenylate/guanylate cyclase domain-containing protein, partial [Actinomycetota bacterium]|nr:adenylate/guanylate cyclase domain-containing protein [Actinomycetota bacterium]